MLLTPPPQKKQFQRKLTTSGHSIEPDSFPTFLLTASLATDVGEELINEVRAVGIDELGKWTEGYRLGGPAE